MVCRKSNPENMLFGKKMIEIKCRGVSQYAPTINIKESSFDYEGAFIINT
jgi:hypothetical protein